ncbi:MAG: hypothetical protein EOO61_12415 [Hymenobacter sp.]|nr:MAG: hypothetical protein EOO61_12415 [Hymenobacter sp.]
MPFLAVDHPTNANGNLAFNSDELVHIVADTQSNSNVPTITLTFKGEKQQIEVPYESMEDRDKVYKLIIEALKPQKVYMKRVN